MLIMHLPRWTRQEEYSHRVVVLFRRATAEGFLSKARLFLAFLLVACICQPTGVRGMDHAGNSAAAAELPAVLELNLTEAVHLALRRNRSIESAYLERILQRFDLARERAHFSPELEVTTRAASDARGYSIRNGYVDQAPYRTRRHSGGIDIDAALTQRIPTGGELTFAWVNQIDRMFHRDSPFVDKETGATGWRVAFTQPLLRGGGIRVNRFLLLEAELREEENRRDLRDALIRTVNGIIRDYRALMLEWQNVDLARDALERAHKHLADTLILIETGRRPANEALQAEADLARRELDLEAARERMDDAQLDLLRRLELDSGTEILLTEEVQLRVYEPNFDDALSLALEQDSRYQASLNNLERAEWNLEKELNRRLWELDLTVMYADYWRHRYPGSGYREEDWLANLKLTIPLPIYGKSKYDWEGGLIDRRIALRRAEMDLHTDRENLESSVRGAVRRVETTLRQVHMAQRTVDLSEKTLTFSELKYQMGQMSHTSFSIEQDRLRDARESLNRTIINYQNALTDLDGLLATTLDTWGIAFRTEWKDLEQEYLGPKTRMLDRGGAKTQP